MLEALARLEREVRKRVGIIKYLLIVISMLLAVAYMTIIERKYLSSMQRRRGPNVVGYLGILQAIADGMKLLLKEEVVPASGSRAYFKVAPVWTFGISVGVWSVLPQGKGVVIAEVPVGILYVLSLTALHVYGVLMAGWASNSKYAFIGAMRATAQMISYEVSIAFIVGIVAVASGGTVNITEIVERQASGWNMWLMLPIFMVFVVSLLAETNRHPFDLPEAESELVSGYNVEYTGMSFGLFYLGETLSIIGMCVLMTTLFLGGWQGGVLSGPLMTSMKTFAGIAFVIWARGAYPRYRYDQLMGLGWKVYLPISMGWLVLEGGVMQGTDALVG